MPRRRRLTDAWIARLRPEAREYTVWDTRVRGLGVRVRPSGARTWIQHRPSAAGVRKVSLGPATARGIDEVRRACLAAAVADAEATPAVRGAAPQFGEFVAGAWKSACYDPATPSIQRSMRSALNSRLLPAFGEVRLDRIRRAAVVRWFDAYSRTAPGGANRALDVLRQILDHAVACGYIAINPARTIRRNRPAKLTRFLSREEIRRLHRVLDDHAERSASARQQVDIIRLLLLTGCRKSEIVRLRWQEVDGDRLDLRKAKTGPRRVFLNEQARTILERRREQAHSPWVFPSAGDPARPRGDKLALWYRVRHEAGLEEVRLHDLRHSVASHAVMLGRSPAGGRAPARSPPAEHDAALRPCRRPRDRGGGGARRSGHLAAHGRKPAGRGERSNVAVALVFRDCQPRLPRPPAGPREHRLPQPAQLRRPAAAGTRHQSARATSEGSGFSSPASSAAALSRRKSSGRTRCESSST